MISFINFVPLQAVMKKLLIISGAVLAFSCLSFSCSKKSTPASGPQSASGALNVSVPSAPCIVYKTKADYSKNLPVILSADKSRIASFPDVSDIRRQGEQVYPTMLEGGFLLDNRGISPDVVFLSLTYDEYGSREKTPLAADLMPLILDRDPITEMYRCGNRSDYGDMVTELNKLIQSGQLSKCQRIK